MNKIIQIDRYRILKVIIVMYIACREKGIRKELRYDHRIRIKNDEWSPGLR